MLLLALLALALGGAAVAALARSFTVSRTRVAAHLDELGAYGYAAIATGDAPSSAERVDGPLAALARRTGDVLARRMGPDREAELRRLLTTAGMYSTSTRTVLGYRALGALALAGVGLLIGHSVPIDVLLAGLLAACGWRLPLILVRRTAVNRAAEIERRVPDLIDQIVVMLEAGVGFSSALQVAATRLEGPLGEEMRLALQEQRMGASLADSLTNLRDRAESTNLASFVRAVVQGERLGVSIAQVMRDLALDMRKRRRQAAEEQAQKTPVKLLLPLIFLILPTIFIVVLVPPILDLFNTI